MSLPESVTILEAAVRRSLVQGSLAESKELLDRYFAEVERIAGQTAAASLPELRDRTQALAEWAVAMVQMSRSQLAADLGKARSLHRYYPADCDQDHLHSTLSEV
jgi:hypothetical protein